MDKNKVIIFSIITLLVIVGIGGFVLLTLNGHDTSKFEGFLLLLLPLIIGISGLGVVQARQSSELQKIGKNVNGNQTRLLNENAALRQQLAYLSGTPLPASGFVVAQVDPITNETVPVQGDTVYPPLMSEDTIMRIHADKDSLPRH